MNLNKLKFLSTIFLFLFSVNAINSQEIATKQDYAHPKEDVKSLSSSVLLIRLNSQKKRMEYRKKAGHLKKLKKLEESVAKEHNEIIEGVRDNFDFCEVLFFYSHDSDAVIKNQDYSLIFDENNQPISSKNYPTSVYLLSLEKPSWYSQVDSYFFVLYGIEKDGIRKLMKPTPFVFRTKSSNLFKRYDFSKAFRIMDERLTNFLNKD